MWLPTKLNFDLSALLKMLTLFYNLTSSTNFQFCLYQAFFYCNS